MFTPANLQTERVSAGQYRLTAPLVYQDSLNGGGIRVSVPEGFVTDYASIPRPLWWLYPPDGSYALPAVVHDYLYRNCRCSRFLADAIFRDAMRSVGVPVLRRIAIYYAVRFFGWLFRTRSGRGAR